MPEWLVELLDLPWETMQLMRAGGEILLPIAGISFWMWFLILRKLAELRTVRRERLLFEQCTLLSSHGLLETSQSWLAKLLLEFRAQRSHDDESDKRLFNTLLSKKSAEIERYVPTILVLASLAPLLGLLGTVDGMISTFDAIARIGTGNPRPLASGISEALITTQYGLIVAIPGLIIGSYLNRRVERFKVRLEELGPRLYLLCKIDPNIADEISGESS
ncbi:MAG: MotA/TolQ/ExbB proton channel family protein [Desulforhabdus sp.]|jgi:biopolymer transport protein ExbB|nr:MotA/TolQ/ExbB proton channel family protein [Desulforhabdus sp.]